MKVLFFAPVITLIVVSCSGVFLRPDRIDSLSGARTYTDLNEVDIPTPDGERLHYSLISAQLASPSHKPKGLVI